MLNGKIFAQEVLTVPVTTLANVWREHVPEGTTVDFLKIDVEGSELEVVAGADWRQYRPEIVVVEGVDPRKCAPTWGTWEPLLLAAGYSFIEFDGLNRWYRRLSSRCLQRRLSGA